MGRTLMCRIMSMWSRSNCWVLGQLPSQLHWQPQMPPLLRPRGQLTFWNPWVRRSWWHRHEAHEAHEAHWWRLCTMCYQVIWLIWRLSMATRLHRSVYIYILCSSMHLLVSVSSSQFKSLESAQAQLHDYVVRLSAVPAVQEVLESISEAPFGGCPMDSQWFNWHKTMLMGRFGHGSKFKIQGSADFSLLLVLIRPFNYGGTQFWPIAIFLLLRHRLGWCKMLHMPRLVSGNWLQTFGSSLDPFFPNILG